MADWDWTTKVAATIAVNLVVICFGVWLLFLSKWAKPKEERARREDVR